MDQFIKQTWWARHKTALVIAGIATVITMGILWLALSDQNYQIAKSKLRIDTVTYGDFQEIVLANGVAEPQTSVLFDAKEGGTVQNIYVEEGAMVKAGQNLFELVNETRQMEYMQRETQMVEQINNMRNTRINLSQNLRNTEDQLQDVNKELNQIETQYHIDSNLFLDTIISPQNWRNTQLNYSYWKEKEQILTKRKSIDSRFHSHQIDRIDESIQLMERNLSIIRDKMNDMQVKAPISGLLNNFDLEKGQVLQANQSAGRIDVPNNYWLRAAVDQHYLNRIAVGQLARIEYNNSSFNLEVSKVQSAVENGQIEIYLSFVEEMPQDLRRGQNFQVYIEVSAKAKATKLAKGAFFNSSGGQYVYVYQPKEKTAVKTPVQLGRQNPEFYEVLSGLAAGQQVITSGYDAFKNFETLEITP